MALGTPVLVFAALGWVVREISKQACKRVIRCEVKEDDDANDNGGEKSRRISWMSRAPTIVPESGVSFEHVSTKRSSMV